MDKNQSLTINYLRFILAVAVIVFHAYVITQNVEWLKIGHPVYRFITYNLALIFGNLGVPFFFFISGYLFYIKGQTSYFQKFKSRFHSLVIPYFLWNLMTVLLFFILQNISFIQGFFSGVNKSVIQYTFKDLLLAFWDCGNWEQGNGKPILTPFWFVRNLILLVVCSPIIQGLNKYLKFYWLIGVGVLWTFTPHQAFSACSIFCFGLGTYLGMQQMDIYISDKRTYKAMFWGCGGMILLLNFFLYFPVSPIFPVVVLRLFIICSIPVIYTIICNQVKRNYLKISQKWVNSTFFLYSFHIFVMMGIRKYMMKAFPDASDILSVLFFILSVVLTCYISYGVYCLLKKCMPRFLALLCGDRC